MTPKEKAQALQKRFDNNYNTTDQQIESALICVEEIMNSEPTKKPNSLFAEGVFQTKIFWQMVKRELQTIRES